MMVGAACFVWCVCVYVDTNYIRCNKRRTVSEQRGDLPVQEKRKGVGRGNAHPAVEVEGGDPLEGRLRLSVLGFGVFWGAVFVL